VQRPLIDGDRVEYDRIDGHTRRSACRLRAADRDQPGLVPVALIETGGLPGERAVQRMHDGNDDSIGHRQSGETRVIVNDIELVSLTAGSFDLGPGARDVI
jgi:hypothetical protein